MKHPGFYFVLLWFIALAGSVATVNYLKNRVDPNAYYVCPPCGCSMHDVLLRAPGTCQACGMPLISLDRRKSNIWESIFRNSKTNFYHHKLFYPINFLALFIGFFALYRFRRELPTLLFLAFFLSLVLYSFKNQLFGTAYSMHASRRWVSFPVSFLMATGPALWLYFLKLAKQEQGLARQDWWHFLPAVVVFLANAALFVGPEAWRDAAIFNNYDHFPGLAEQVAFVASGLFYGFLSLQLTNYDSGTATKFSRWQKSLPYFLLAVVVAMAIMLFGNFYYSDLMSTWMDYLPVWLTISIFTLWCCYLLVFKKEAIFQKETKKETRLSDPKIAALKLVVDEVMQSQRPYLNPDLSLQLLAQIVGIKEKDLSEVLNSGFAKNFHDYVNLYRLEEVKKMLLDPNKQHLTNLAMAQEAGFSSKSTFFGLFKKHVGMTPGEYKKRQ